MLNRLASVYMELIVVFIVKQKMTCFNQRTEKGRRMKILWVSFMLYLLSHNILCFKRGTIARRVARGGTGSEIRETGGPALSLPSHIMALGKSPNLSEL